MSRHPHVQDVVVAARAGDADDSRTAPHRAARGRVAHAAAHRPPLVRAQRSHRAHRRQVLSQPRGAQGILKYMLHVQQIFHQIIVTEVNVLSSQLNHIDSDYDQQNTNTNKYRLLC